MGLTEYEEIKYIILGQKIRRKNVYFLFLFFCLLSFFRAHSQHVEVPRIGVQ